MEKVLEELNFHRWDFIVYRTEGGFVINVVFYSSAIDYHRSFRIDENEARMDIEELKKLSERIRNNYDLYKEQEIIPLVKI